MWGKKKRYETISAKGKKESDPEWVGAWETTSSLNATKEELKGAFPNSAAVNFLQIHGLSTHF